jgi:hypothetical protein
MKKPHYKSGSYSRVADNLYRYSSTKKYYGVFKCNGKTKDVVAMWRTTGISSD